MSQIYLSSYFISSNERGDADNIVSFYSKGVSQTFDQIISDLNKKYPKETPEEKKKGAAAKKEAEADKKDVQIRINNWQKIADVPNCVFYIFEYSHSKFGKHFSVTSKKAKHKYQKDDCIDHECLLVVGFSELSCLGAMCFVHPMYNCGVSEIKEALKATLIPISDPNPIKILPYYPDTKGDKPAFLPESVSLIHSSTDAFDESAQEMLGSTAPSTSNKRKSKNKLFQIEVRIKPRPHGMKYFLNNFFKSEDSKKFFEACRGLLAVDYKQTQIKVRGKVSGRNKTYILNKDDAGRPVEEITKEVGSDETNFDVAKAIKYCKETMVDEIFAKVPLAIPK